MPSLTARQVQAKREPGMYADGGGLYLCVAKGGTKSWILRTTVRGRTTASGQPYRVEIGLGSTATVSLAEARGTAVPLLKLARQGVNPLQERKREALTFEDAAKRVHANLLPTWRSERHGEIWMASLKREVFPHIGNRPIHSIETADVLSVLAPIWTEKHDTARRIKQRIAGVFDWAKGAGHYSRENPVNGLEKALAPVKHQVEHMASLPWREVPDFFADLKAREGISARALEFVILTAGRSGEIRGARWSEIQGDVWEIPSARMKASKPHRVPLTDPALAVLDAVRGLDSDLIFPSVHRDRGNRARQMSDTVFKALMLRMKRDGLTTHGFRSSFRDWCGESARADREVAEAALAHEVGGKVERAYARSDLFERRRELMVAWSRYVTGQSGQVVKLVRA